MCMCHTFILAEITAVLPCTLSCSMDMLCAMNDQILTMRGVATYLKLAEKTA